MAERDELDRIVVVLVRARNPGNIGAVARAMHDFGFRHLRVVNEFEVPFEAAKSAVDASTVLESAERFDEVAASVSDCTLVVGTTAVGERVLQHPLRVLTEAAEVLLQHVADDSPQEPGRVAILFGSEKTGLSNEELSHCHWLLTIPMEEYADVRHPSMNLGQAVAVCLYELVRGRSVGSEEVLPRGASAARVEEVERVALLLHELLEKAGYKKHHPANSELEDLRRLVVRMGLTAADAPVWLGILRQLLWGISQSR